MVKEITPTFQTLDFFEKRGDITLAIRTGLEKKFLLEGGYWRLWDFQLRQISLPAAFETAVVNKILRKQERQKARNQQQVEVKKAEKQKEIDLAEADAGLVNALATEEGRINIDKQAADGQANLTIAYAEGYFNFGQTMNWFNDTDLSYDALHYYIYSRLGKDHRANRTTQLLGYGPGYVANSKLVSRSEL